MSKTILDSQASRRCFVSGAGFAVPVTTKLHPHDEGWVDRPAHYSPATCTLREQCRGVDGVSYRAGWAADYVVRVWPKHNDTRFRVPPPKPTGGDIDPASVRTFPPGTYFASRELTDREIADTIKRAERSIEASGKTVYRNRK